MYMRTIQLLRLGHNHSYYLSILVSLTYILILGAHCKLRTLILTNQIFFHNLRFRATWIFLVSSCWQVSSFNTYARGSTSNQIYTSKSPHCSKNDYIRWKNCQGRDFTINGLVYLSFLMISAGHIAGSSVYFSQDKCLQVNVQSICRKDLRLLRRNRGY